MNAMAVDYTYWRNNYGLRLLAATSSETKNAIELDKKYTNKIDYLFSATVLYKYDLGGNFSLVSGVGRTTYRTTWLVDGIAPWWAKDTDSDWSYYSSIRYELNSKTSIEFGYTDYYRKHKQGFGNETTRGFNASFIYKF